MINPNIKTHKVSIGTLVDTARELVSEHGENAEYDRALVELIAVVAGFSPADHRDDIERLIRGETA